MPRNVTDPQYTLFVRLRDADDPPAFDASRLSQHKSHHYQIPSRTSLHGGLASALIDALRPLDDQQAFDAHWSVDSGQSLPQSRASLLDSEEPTTVFQSRTSLLDSVFGHVLVGKRESVVNEASVASRIGFVSHAKTQD